MSGRSSVYTFIGKDEFSPVAKNVEKSASGMSTKMGKLGKTMGVGLAAGVAAVGAAAVGAGVAIGKMAINAAEDEAAQRRLDVALRNTTGATKSQVAEVEKYIAKMGMARGVTDDEMRPALQRLAQSTGDIESAQRLMGVAMDVSAGSGKSLEAVTTAIAKANNGNMGALSRLGVKIKDADGKALTFDQTMKGLASTFEGQSAAAADSLDGKIGRLKLAFDEAKESIGGFFLPAAETAITWIVDEAIPGIQDLGDEFSDFGEQIKPIADTILPALGDAFQTIKDYGPDIGEGLLKMASWSVKAFRGLSVAGYAAAEAFLWLGASISTGENRVKNFAMLDDFRQWKDRSLADMEAVSGALEDGANWLDAYGERAKSVEKANLRADISDLTAKIAAGKEKLADPALSDTKRAKLEAKNDQMLTAIAEARNRLAELGDKRINVEAAVNVKIYGKEFYIQPGTNKHIPLFEATGGLIRGPGSGTSDDIPAMLSNGEYVIRASAVQRYGSAFFDALNSGTTSGAGGGTSSAPPGGGIVVNVHGGMDSAETIARRVQTALLDLKRRQGVNLGLA